MYRVHCYYPGDEYNLAHSRIYALTGAVISDSIYGVVLRYVLSMDRTAVIYVCLNVPCSLLLSGAEDICAHLGI